MNSSTASASLAERFEPRSETDTRLRGRRLILARIAWATVVSLIVALFLARLPAYYTALQTYVQSSLDSVQALQKLGLSVSAYAAFTLALEIALAFLCFTLGAVIFWRRSDDWMALLVALMVVATVTLNGNGVFGSHSAWRVLAIVLYVLGSGVYLLVFSLFPDGRFVPNSARAQVVVYPLTAGLTIPPHGGEPAPDLLPSPVSIDPSRCCFR